MKVDMNIEVCNPADYDILIIPGGEPAPFDKDDRWLRLIQGFDEQDKVISAICGSPAFLATADVLHERKYSTSIIDDSIYKNW